MSNDWFVFQARHVDTVDGDTVDLLVDLGFRAQRRVRVRLEGVDTNEIFGVEHGSRERMIGLEQKRFVEDWFDRDSDREWPYILDTSSESGKYGRWPGVIECKATGEVLNYDIVEKWPCSDSEPPV